MKIVEMPQELLQIITILINDIIIKSNIPG